MSDSTVSLVGNLIAVVIFIMLLILANLIYMMGWENGISEKNSHLFQRCLEINSTMQYAEAKNLCTEFVKR
jgi:hypothetical protein